MDKFKKKIKEQAAIKANESRSRFHGNQHVEVCSPNGDHTKIKTDKELAKMAGVGTGTVARYDAVMKSDDEELKEKVKTGQVKIGTAYREVKKLSLAIFHKRANEFYFVKVFALAKECSVELLLTLLALPTISIVSDELPTVPILHNHMR